MYVYIAACASLIATGIPGGATRDKQSVSGARTLRAGTQSVQALSSRARSNTVGEGRNSRCGYSGYTAISVPAVTGCVHTIGQGVREVAIYLKNK